MTDAAEPIGGKPAGRMEDSRLLLGEGRFVDDAFVDNQCVSLVVRSVHAHARLVALETNIAARMPGIRTILTARDLEEDGIGGIPWEVCPPLPVGRSAPPEGDPTVAPPQPLLARDRVRYVGEPVAFIVADTLDQARDAAERIEIIYDPLPSVVDAFEATKPHAPRLHDQFDGNLCFTFELGDSDTTDRAFAAADVVVELAAANQRLAPAPTEPRGYIGVWDVGSRRWTLYAAAGKPHPIRRTLARFIFAVEEERLHVVVRDVGGSFGGKNVLYAEAALVLWAARRVNRPVRWIQNRTESFVSDVQGRDHTSVGALALAADGRMLAIRLRSLVNLGAWLCPRGVMPAISGARLLCGVYRIPASSVSIKGIVTNTVSTGPYRGTGAPEVMFMLERLVDLAALRLDVDAAELRRMNLIAPSMPATPWGSGHAYDSSDFPHVLRRALELADWNSFATRRRQSQLRGRLRGRGISFSIEAFGARYGEEATVEIGDDRTIVLLIGTLSAGQSHHTVYAEIVAQRFGLPRDSVIVIQGDTDRIPRGNGTGASRSLTVGGSAALRASDAAIEKGAEIAAQQLQVSVDDIHFEAGVYCARGTNRSINIFAISRLCGGLAATTTFEPKAYNFPYGCHAAEVEVDVETGLVDLVTYSGVHDCGAAINPSVVLGQLHGGLTQGVGQALLEHCVCEPESGQVLSGSLMDYALPRAADVPSFALELYQTATPINPLGAKAVGEAGPTASPPAIINAIVDALSPLGVTHVEMPATPARVWRAIREAQRTGRHPAT